MRRVVSILAILIVAWIVESVISHMRDSSDTITYQGQTVKLSKSYSDYDDFKEDPNNIATQETQRVQELVKSARIASRFSDRMQMIQAVSNVKFPGYGMTSFGEQPQKDGSVLALSGIEIPRADQTRYILFRGNGGTYTLIDDFVYADSAQVESVSAVGDKLIYLDGSGTKLFERKATAK